MLRLGEMPGANSILIEALTDEQAYARLKELEKRAKAKMGRVAESEAVIPTVEAEAPNLEPEVPEVEAEIPILEPEIPFDEEVPNYPMQVDHRCWNCGDWGHLYKDEKGEVICKVPKKPGRLFCEDCGKQFVTKDNCPYCLERKKNLRTMKCLFR